MTEPLPPPCRLRLARQALRDRLAEALGKKSAACRIEIDRAGSE